MHPFAPALGGGSDGSLQLVDLKPALKALQEKSAGEVAQVAKIQEQAETLQSRVDEILKVRCARDACMLCSQHEHSLIHAAWVLRRRYHVL